MSSDQPALSPTEKITFEALAAVGLKTLILDYRYRFANDDGDTRCKVTGATQSTPAGTVILDKGALDALLKSVTVELPNRAPAWSIKNGTAPNTPTIKQTLDIATAGVALEREFADDDFAKQYGAYDSDSEYDDEGGERQITLYTGRAAISVTSPLDEPKPLNADGTPASRSSNSFSGYGYRSRMR